MNDGAAHTIGPRRRNGWVSIGVFAFSFVTFVALGRRVRERDDDARPIAVEELAAR